VDSEIRDAWAAWLSGSFKWDYFGTVTFREPLPRHRGEAVLNSIGKTLKRHGMGIGFLGMELHASRFLHCHFLYLSRPTMLEPKSAIWRDLFDTYGYSRVEDIRDPHEAARYVTKYCVKALADYAFFRHNARTERESSR
jgi:hypothetical protein